MEFVVDVQGFKSPYNIFIFKELAVMRVVDNAQPAVYTFEPPYCWNIFKIEDKSANRWTEKNYLGIGWNSGDIPYNKLTQTLQNAVTGATRVYVKGAEKKKHIEQVLHSTVEVVTLESLGCPPLRSLPRINCAPCHHHELLPTKSICAARNVQIIKDWLDEYLYKLADEACILNMYN